MPSETGLAGDLLDLFSVLEICAHCARTVQDDSEPARTASNAVICSACRENYYVACDRCAGVIQSYATITPADNMTVCRDCLDEHYFECDRCDDYFERSGMNVTRNNSEVCNTCLEDHYSACDRCEEYEDDDDTIETVRGSIICIPCRRAYYWRCDRCDGWNRDGANCGNDCCDPDYCECDECSPNGSSEYLHDYSYKPYPEFHGDGPLYLGPEIEVEVGYSVSLDEAAGYAADTLGSLGYLKEDSSLNNGFEIVLHPMSYGWAMENFPWDMLTRLREMGCHTEPYNNGLHVHVSKAGFASPCHKYRWMKFIYRNQEQVTKLARRESSNYAAFHEHERRHIKDYAKGTRRYGERYQAINPNNAETFELRMFASSLNPDEVKAAFGFASASVEYTRHLTYGDIAKRGGWTWEAFSQWLAERPDYAPLSREITRQMEVSACVS